MRRREFPLQGDPEDRKAVLAHKQWVQEEEERLGKLRQDWLRRRDQKRKAADRKRHIKKQKVGAESTRSFECCCVCLERR